MSNLGNPYAIAAQVLIEGLISISKTLPTEPHKDVAGLEALGQSTLEKMVSTRCA